MTDEERCLWKWQTGCSGAGADDSTSRPPNLPCPTTTTNGDGGGAEENYPFLLRKYGSRATPVPWWRLCANAVVVVQEFVLVVYVLMIHRVMALLLASSSSAVRQEESEASTTTVPTTTWDFDFFFAKRNDPVLLTTTTMIMVLTSLYLPIHTWSPLRRSSRSSWTAANFLVGPCVGAMMFRVVALALRYLIALLFSLAHCQYCECAGMLIHLLVKDYSLANGMMKRLETTDRDLPRDKMPPTTSLSLTELLSLKNVGIFSSLLANSQVDDSFLVGSYMAILIFIHYPRYQPDVTRACPPHRSVFPWMTVGGVICADCILLWRLEVRYIVPFLVSVGALTFAIPAWKYHLRKSKLLIRGQWDLPVKKSMKLYGSPVDRCDTS